MAQEREADRTDKARSSDNRSGKGRVSQAGEVAQEAGRQAIDAASALASQATEQVQQAVRRQFRGGADVVEEVADAVRAAGRRLDETMPTAAELARSAARRIDTFADGVRDQSVTELLQGTAKFARRRPGIIFGATALVGFVVLRVLNATPTRQDAEEDRDRNEQRDATARDQLGSNVEVATDNRGEADRAAAEDDREAAGRKGKAGKSSSATAGTRKSTSGKAG